MKQDLLFGAMVISARRYVVLPVLSSEDMADHLPGSVFHGRCGTVSPRVEQVSLPSRGVHHTLHAGCSSSDKELAHLSSLVISHRKSTSQEDMAFKEKFIYACNETTSIGDYRVLHQSSPFGLVGLFSKESGMRLFGLYSKDCEMIVWTNTPDVESLMPSGANGWWVHRFKERSSFEAMLHTSRICHKWYRWGSLEIGMRFQALERHIFQ